MLSISDLGSELTLSLTVQKGDLNLISSTVSGSLNRGKICQGGNILKSIYLNGLEFGIYSPIMLGMYYK